MRSSVAPPSEGLSRGRGTCSTVAMLGKSVIEGSSVVVEVEVFVSSVLIAAPGSSSSSIALRSLLCGSGVAEQVVVRLSSGSVAVAKPDEKRRTCLRTGFMRKSETRWDIEGGTGCKVEKRYERYDQVKTTASGFSSRGGRRKR